MNRFRLGNRFCLGLAVLIGLVLAANAYAIPDRKQWQTLKDKYKIKKGIAKVNMGKSFENFTKTFDKYQKKDPKQVLKALDKLDKDLAAYTADAKKAKVDGKFLAELADIDKQIGQMRSIFESKTDPFKVVKQRLANAMSGFKKLKKDSPGADFKQFYKEDFRLIGMALKDLIAKEPDFKSVANDFFKNANPVNAADQKLAPPDKEKGDAKNDKLKAQMYSDIQTALNKLNAVMKKL